VLIVEDNDLNVKLFRDLLETHGYKTMRSRGGVEAIELARTHKPCLILMDIQLPEVDGLELTRRLKQDPQLKSIPVIAVTAFAMPGDKQRILEGGCADYIASPISVSEFLETIRRHVSNVKA
jgi:two-component system cell cycle response regulator DivK